jgi:hypothetical protein
MGLYWSDTESPDTLEAFIVPPRPFADADRKASHSRDQHNTVPGKLTTALFASPKQEHGPRGTLRPEEFDPESCRTPHAQRLFKFRQNGL